MIPSPKPIFRLPAFAAVLLSFGVPAVSAGVWAHYSFDTDYSDSSGFGRHGTLTDVGTLGNSGITTGPGTHVFGGGAMDFSDDRDYLALPSKTFGSGSPYTIAFWAQRDSAARTWDMAVGQRDNTNFFIALNGRSTLRWRSSSSASNRQEDFAAAADTGWHHYAIVGQGSNLIFYRDGTPVATGTNKLTGFIIDTIGDAYTDSDFDFQGRLDEVWILDEAADATAINGLYQSNDPGMSGPVGDPSVQRLRIVLIGGQSNGDGRAPTSELPTSPVNLQSPQADVDFFYNIQGGSPTLTTLRPGLSETGQFGPEISMGRSLANLYSQEANTRVALIKYANGGTNLHTQWKGGGDNTTSGDGTEYLVFQQTVTQGLATLAAAYPNASLDLESMVWMQGESDANGNQATYQVNLIKFIADVRATYGSGLPFVIGRLSSKQTAVNAAGLATIRAAQDGVAAADPRTDLVDTDSFAVKSDKLHFNGAGQLSLGTAFAKETAYAIWRAESFAGAAITAGDGEPGQDPDGDGKTNAEEFSGASDPLSATSFFNAWLSPLTDLTLQLSYDSSIYRVYAVERFETLTDTWTEILPAEPGNGTVQYREIDKSAATGLFRVNCRLH